MKKFIRIVFSLSAFGYLFYIVFLENSETESTTKSTTESYVYVPNDGASLAASQDCYDKMSDAVNAGDKNAFQRLVDNNCVLIYDSSKQSLELVLDKVGGMTEPNIYFIKGNSSARIWALRSQVRRK